MLVSVEASETAPLATAEGAEIEIDNEDPKPSPGPVMEGPGYEGFCMLESAPVSHR